MQLLDALELSRLTMKTVRQNLWWAFAYNIVSYSFLMQMIIIAQTCYFNEHMDLQLSVCLFKSCHKIDYSKELISMIGIGYLNKNGAHGIA